MRQIIWTEEAESDYSANIDYLIKEWTLKEAEEFIEKTESLINLLMIGRVKHKVSKFEGIRECIVCKQITLFYRINEKNNIELLKFWNNYRDKKRLEL
ncbi:MAG: type II toxin-antitoxin system RelE/ParE family toxin [Tenuifilaceae bacterium]|jgi:plasmid stabilization system protein ParE|nr:type II toxin-antitoxin system RelE/ParE family toxin [Tenuifilaceae bacterium]